MRGSMGAPGTAIDRWHKMKAAENGISACIGLKSESPNATAASHHQYASFVLERAVSDIAASETPATSDVRVESERRVRMQILTRFAFRGADDSCRASLHSRNPFSAKGKSCPAVPVRRPLRASAVDLAYGPSDCPVLFTMDIHATLR